MARKPKSYYLLGLLFGNIIKLQLLSINGNLNLLLAATRGKILPKAR